MDTKIELLELIKDQSGLRTLLREPVIVKKLESIGVSVRVFELHAPAKGAKRREGLGVTLCGRNRAMRNTTVTCKKCIGKLQS